MVIAIPSAFVGDSENLEHIAFCGDELEKSVLQRSWGNFVLTTLPWLPVAGTSATLLLYYMYIKRAGVPRVALRDISGFLSQSAQMAAFALILIMRVNTTDVTGTAFRAWKVR
jgi:hypothetical protein